MVLFKPFDLHLQKTLAKDLGSPEAEEVYARYVQTAADLRPIWARIAGSEPNLTDHSIEHVQHVLQNAWSLLGEKPAYSGMELYMLAMLIMFHDVGNLLGRTGHQRKIGKIFDEVRTPGSSDDEKAMVLAACEAHCGHTPEGAADTLKPLKSDPRPLRRQTIRLQELAAILRLADELAEGPKRTCRFLINNRGFTAASRIYHSYAAATTISIMPNQGRVVAQYNVHVKTQGTRVTNLQRTNLTELLEFIYERVNKMNAERRFNSFYCEPLRAFTRTEVSITLHIKHNICPLLTNPIVLDDLTDPAAQTFDPRGFDELKQAAIDNLVQAAARAK